MAAKVSAVVVLGGGICFACFSSLWEAPPAPKQGPRPGQPPPKAVEDVSRWVYTVLTNGGSLSAGTVASVNITDVKPGDGWRPYEEWGTLRFRVQRSVAGPARNELEIPYWYEAEEAGRIGPAVADWSAGSLWIFAPGPGQRLLLLLYGPRDAKEGMSRFGTPVAHIWKVARADPLVEAFADAGHYLAARDDETRTALFRRMCRSEFRNLRYFALDAAFYYLGLKDRYGYGDGYDPVRQSNLALDYLKLAVPLAADEDERAEVTFAFRWWFQHTRPRDLTPALRAACEEWYVTELASIDRPVRCKQALDRLKDLLDKGEMATVLALFPTAGRAGLVKCLENVAASGSHARVPKDTETTYYVNGVVRPWSSGRLTVAGKGQELLRRLAAK